MPKSSAKKRLKIQLVNKSSLIRLAIVFAYTAFLSIFGSFIQHVLSKKNIESKVDKIVLYETIFGLKKKSIKIDRYNLPLIEKQKTNNKIPQIENKKLIIKVLKSHNNKELKTELAGDLLADTLEVVEDTYNCYLNNNFAKFYEQIQPIYIISYLNWTK